MSRAYDVHQRLATLKREFAGVTPRRVIRDMDDGAFDVKGDDGKHALLSDDGSAVRIDYFVDTKPDDQTFMVTESLIDPSIVTAEASDVDVLTIVCDYLGNPGLPVRTT
jgi:hypothetical protein